MATVSIQKIQVRRGLAADLPGQPNTSSPASLDVGEFGFTVDVMRLFFGAGLNHALSGMPNYARTTFPYQNVEALTENSPLPEIFGGVMSDNQNGFRQSAPLYQSTSFLNLQVPDASTVPCDFYLDLSSSGANVVLCYFVLASTGVPFRSGRLTVLWTPPSAPFCTDEAQTLIGSYLDLQFQAAVIGTGANQHVVLQYTNQSGGSPVVAFNLIRPCKTYMPPIPIANGTIYPALESEAGAAVDLTSAQLIYNRPSSEQSVAWDHVAVTIWNAHVSVADSGTAADTTTAIDLHVDASALAAGALGGWPVPLMP
jgi:hypothetical protein